jgi:hypothetical protein
MSAKDSTVTPIALLAVLIAPSIRSPFPERFYIIKSMDGGEFSNLFGVMAAIPCLQPGAPTEPGPGSYFTDWDSGYA